MANLKVNGRLIVDNFYKKFEALYPYLNPAFFYPKAIGGGEVDTSLTIANARARSIRQDLKGYTSTDEADMDISPNTKIKDFQSEINKNFHIVCSVQCRLGEKKFLGLGKTEYKWTAIGNTKYASMTLGEANEQLKRDGAQPVTEIRTKGNNLGNRYL